MVVIGVGAVLLATLEYRQDIRMLSAPYPDILRTRVVALIVMIFR
jgi:hypothetical protein